VDDLNKIQCIQDPALQNPHTPLEVLAARFNNFKKPEGAEENSGVYLASESDINSILAIWNLPQVYVEFLRRFSPKGTSPSVVSNIFGAHEIFSFQDRDFDTYNEERIFIGDLDILDGGYFLDLTQLDQHEAPVYLMDRETGSLMDRDFQDTEKPISRSFLEFLEKFLDAAEQEALEH
jgi:hypothetical protein